MESQVTVTEPKPIRSAQAAGHLQGMVSIAGEAPSGYWVDKSGQGVNQGIAIGGDMEPQKLVIVSGVGNNRNLLRRKNL